MSISPHGGEDPAAIASRLTPMHYAIFERLPDEGSVFGLNPLVETVTHLRDSLNQILPDGAKVASSFVQGQMRALAVWGLVVRVQTIGNANSGWQRTQLAKRLLDEKQETEESTHDDDE